MEIRNDRLVEPKSIFVYESGLIRILTPDINSGSVISANKGRDGTNGKKTCWFV